MKAPEILEIGDFEPMDNENFVYYMAYSAPRILGELICREMAVHMNEMEAMDPWGIRGINPGGYPRFSNNVSGYHLLCKISIEQARELINLEITSDEIPGDEIEGLLICQELLTYVSENLLEVTIMEIIKENPSSDVGSVSQMAFIKLASRAPNIENVDKFTF